MGTCFLYGNGGSGGTGASLNVTAPAAGITVTVSTDRATSSGAQLFDINDTKALVYCNIISDDIINIDFRNGDTSQTWINFFTNVSKLLKPSTEYAVIVEVFEFSGVSGFFAISTNSSRSESQFKSDVYINVSGQGIYVAKATTKESFDSSGTMLRSFIPVPANTAVKAKLRISVIDDTSVTSDTFVYRPFTGGTYLRKYSKTKVAGANGVAVFKGLATGTWTLSITDGSQTASKPVDIVADYATSITFFSATIHITYPAGSVCTITDGKTTLTAPDTSGIWDCVVQNAGTWTVTYKGSVWTSVDITTSGQDETVNVGCLYDAGNQYESVTGGWVGTQTVSGSTTSGGKLTVNDDNLSFTNASGGSFGVATQNAIDLTGYTTLHVLHTGKARLMVADAYPTGRPVAEYASDRSYTDKTEITLDVSAVTGAHKIAISDRTASAVKVYKVWMT